MKEPPAIRTIDIVHLRDAVLCVDCNCISASNNGCRACGSNSVMSLARVLDRKPAEKISRIRRASR